MINHSKNIANQRIITGSKIVQNLELNYSPTLKGKALELCNGTNQNKKVEMNTDLAISYCRGFPGKVSLATKVKVILTFQ